MNSRRVLAVVLPQLLCELVASEIQPKKAKKVRRKRVAASTAFAVVLRAEAEISESTRSTSDTQSSERIQSPSSSAYQCGVRSGQSVTEARAIMAHLKIVELTEAQVVSALQRIAESFLKFTATVSISVESSRHVVSDKQCAVWLDITGAAHLFGGEEELCQEVSLVASELGHVSQLAIANGPRLAWAFARWQSGPNRPRIVPQSKMASDAARLPVLALPITEETRGWLIRLGVFTFSDVHSLPSKALSVRIGRQSAEVLALVRGDDLSLLEPYTPTALPLERVAWDEPVVGSQPLLFALRGLTSKIAKRLEGRGVAAQKLRLSVALDSSIATLLNKAKLVVLDFELASPLFREEELYQVMSSRLSNAKCGVPSVALELEILSQTGAHQRQLNLSSVQSNIDAGSPEALAVLFGELAADIGRHRFGCLKVLDAHCPEKQSLLSPVALSGKEESGGPLSVLPLDESVGFEPPRRLLVKPVQVKAPFRKGALLPFQNSIYSVECVQFELRLDCAEWWSVNQISRDYVRLWLKGSCGALEVLAFVDRTTGERFVQGVYC